MDRFWEKVDKTGGEDACWNWTAHRNACGYGTFKYGKIRRAHRAAWELTRGPIPEGMCVCHTCDNPACVNPAHLWLGTPGQNAADRTVKGRNVAPKGEAHGGVKLTEEQVLDIRKTYAQGNVSQESLGHKYGVNQRQISRIVRGTSWHWGPYA